MPENYKSREDYKPTCGHWINTEIKGFSKCSNCHGLTQTPNQINQYFHFCPHCGKPMLGGAN